GAEDLALAELGRQLAEQLLHRGQHALLVDVLVVLPVGLGVVGLQALVELDGLGRPALEGHAGGGYSRPSTSEAARSATVHTTDRPTRSRSHRRFSPWRTSPSSKRLRMVRTGHRSRAATLKCTALIVPSPASATSTTAFGWRAAARSTASPSSASGERTPPAPSTRP